MNLIRLGCLRLAASALLLAWYFAPASLPAYTPYSPGTASQASSPGSYSAHGYSSYPSTIYHSDGQGSCNCQQCQSAAPCRCDFEDRWSFRVSALSFRRPTYQLTPSPILGNFGTNTLNMNSGYNAGYEFELFRNFGDHWRITARYLSADLSASDQLASLPDAQFTLGSELRSFDLMFRRSMWKWFNPSIGYRSVEVDASERQFREINPMLHNMVDLRLSNDMSGLQIGTDGQILEFKRLSFDYLVNYASLDNTINAVASLDAGGGPTRVARASSNTVNLGEFGIASNLKLTDTLSARVGYRVIVLDGIADPSGDDSIPFSGFDFGMRFVW